MNDLFDKMGGTYEYTYENNTVTISIPSSDAQEFRDKLIENTDDYINDMIAEKIANSVKFNEDYAEVEINFIKESANNEILNEVISFLATNAITYQSFNGVPIEELNLHVKIYIDGTFNQELDMNLN